MRSVAGCFSVARRYRMSLSSKLLFALFLTACSSSASTPSPDASPTDASPDASPDASRVDALPTWPTAWSADIAWSDFAADETTQNTWTGHVSYDWSLRAMRTEVVPPAGGTPGPPIGEAGAMLMRDGNLYYLPASGGCTLVASFGAPRPNWLSAANATAASSTRPNASRADVDLAPLDSGLAGCFHYLFDPRDQTPIRFGGSSTCGAWPKGSYIAYSNYVVTSQSASAFDVPASCAKDANADGSAGCHACHDAP